MPTTVLISDLHLGATSGHDVLRRPAMRERLLEAIERVDAERIVLLGDIVELRDGPLGESLLEAREFFRAVGAAFAGKDVVLVPGNHDHRLLGSWLERAGEGDEPVALDELIADPHPAVDDDRRLARRRRGSRSATPGSGSATTSSLPTATTSTATSRCRRSSGSRSPRSTGSAAGRPGGVSPPTTTSTSTRRSTT